MVQFVAMLLMHLSFEIPAFGGNLVLTVIPQHLTNIPTSECEIIEFLNTNGGVAIIQPGEVPSWIMAFDLMAMKERRGETFKDGELYGINAVSAITSDIVLTGETKNLDELTPEERKALSSQHNGLSIIDLNSEKYTLENHISAAEQMIALKAKESGWQIGDPNVTLWNGMAKKLPEQLVGSLISGYEQFGPVISFYAGKVRKLFATEYTNTGHWIWAELLCEDGSIITVPLSFTAKKYAFNIFGAPLERNWFR